MNGKNNTHGIMFCFAWVFVPFFVSAASYDPFNSNPTQWDVDQARQEARRTKQVADDLGRLSLEVTGHDWHNVVRQRNDFEQESRRHSWNAQQLEDRMWDNRRREEEEARREENRRQEEEWRQRREEENRRQGQAGDVGFRGNLSGQDWDDGQVVFAQHQVLGATGDDRFRPPCPQPGDARTFDSWVLKVRMYWRKVGIKYSGVIDAGMVNYYNAHLGEKVIDKIMGNPVPAKVAPGCPSPGDYKSRRSFVEAYVSYKRKEYGNRSVDYRTNCGFYSDADYIWSSHQQRETERKKAEDASNRAEIKELKKALRESRQAR